MTHGFKHYPNYKDSGVAWLGQIPTHWQQQGLGSLLSRTNLRNRTDLPLLSVVREKGVVLRSSMSDDENHNYIPDDLNNYRVVRRGNIVINKMKAWQGSLGVSRYDGIVSPAYFVFDTQFSNVAYIHALLRSKPYIALLAQASDGIRVDQWDLSTDRMKRIPVLIPSDQEQLAIVRFLDRVDHLIRRYIAAKKKLIALLNEQKQAIIHRAVTRGLDAYAALKPSNIQGLLEIPAHWEVRRLRTLLTRIDQGVSPQAEAGLADINSWGVLKAGCVNRGVFREGEHKRLPDGFAIDPAIVVHKGDVLVSRASGSPGLVGSVGRVSELTYRLVLSDKTFRLIFTDPRLIDFAVATMNTRYYRTQVEQALSGAEGLANNLPLSALKNFRLVMPPPTETQDIVDSLTRETASLDATIGRAQRGIDSLLEYRTRLIADVVTGKLDVREAAAQLPNQPDAPEMLDVADTPADDEAEADPAQEWEPEAQEQP